MLLVQGLPFTYQNKEYPTWVTILDFLREMIGGETKPLLPGIWRFNNIKILAQTCSD